MNQRGFSLLELVVVVILIGIMAGVLLERVLPLIGRAERVAFLETQSQLNSALLLEAAERVVRGEARTLPQLARGNPMDLLLKPPGNYLGALVRPDVEKLPRASWYYDELERRLVYRPGRQTRFEALDGPPDRIEMTVRFVFADRDGDGSFNPSRDHFDGLHVESRYAYRWPD